MKLATCILAAALAISPAWADSDHDRVRRAVEEGRILPLKDILARCEARHPGQLLEAELEDEHGALIYELKVLGADGRVVKLYFDAGTGELLKVKEKGGRQ